MKQIELNAGCKIRDLQQDYNPGEYLEVINVTPGKEFRNARVSARIAYASGAERGVGTVAENNYTVVITMQQIETQYYQVKDSDLVLECL